MRLPVGSRGEGRTEITLFGKQLDTMIVVNSQAGNEERNTDYTLLDTEEGFQIYEEEWLISGSVEIEPGQAPAELTRVQSCLYSIDEARASDSPVMQEVLERFSQHL